MDEATRQLVRDLLRREDLRPRLDEIREHDAVTFRHSLRVALLAAVMGRADGLSERALANLAVAALLHDHGKSRLDETVVAKPGPLTEEEREHLRRHPALGVEALASLEAFPDAHRIAPLHHEGQGEHSYPRSGDERRGRRPGREDRRRPIPAWVARAGRILALADRFDALVSRRPYKAPWEEEEVRALLGREMPDVAGLLAAVRRRERPPA